MHVHICRAPDMAFRRKMYCRWCDRATWTIDHFHGWYGTTLECTSCGVITDTEYGERNRPVVGYDPTDARRRWREARPLSEWSAVVSDYFGWGDDK